MTMTISEMKELNNECCQENCNEKAVYFVFWPGENKKRMCESHKNWAKNISNAMGFFLHTEEIEVDR